MRYFLLALLIVTSCGPKPENEYTAFVFQLPFQMTARDTVAVGDTLWLTADFSDQLRELYSGNTYSVTPQNFELRFDLGLFELNQPSKTLPSQPSATNAFRFVSNNGSLMPLSETFSKVKLAYTQNQYKFKVGLIPERRGVFCASFLDGWLSSDIRDAKPDLSYLVPGRTADGGKRIAIFDGFDFYINEGKTNFYLYKEHCRALSLDADPAISKGNTNAEQEASFTFVVR